jgi:hypothetical protein
LKTVFFQNFSAAQNKNTKPDTPQRETQQPTQQNFTQTQTNSNKKG